MMEKKRGDKEEEEEEKKRRLVVVVLLWGTALSALLFLIAFLPAYTTIDMRLNTLDNDLQQTNDTLSNQVEDIQTQLDNLNISAPITDYLRTVNSVAGDVPNQNIDILVDGVGLDIAPNPMASTISLKNTGVVTINSVPSSNSFSDILAVGIGMISVNSFPLTSTIEIDGTALSTSLSNLQMQTNTQQMEIATLEGNVTDLQTQINNLQMAGEMIAQDLNGTVITFNMTFVELINDVMTLESTVISLQNQINAITSAAVPTGTITPFGGTVVPAGYLACDGSVYLIATHPALHTVIGTMFCGVSCPNITVFAVPDFRGRVPAGQGGTALSGTIGTNVGAETHTLTPTEMPIHTHSGVIDPVPDHFHLIPLKRATDLAGAHTHTITIGNAGSGGAHNNIQPSLIVRYIIKT